ncbi:MAG TPA: inositol monophosphatase family protein [Sphingomicrobium sp.]|jgi:myo-inositol-1(or 4)-monophosphatase
MSDFVSFALKLAEAARRETLGIGSGGAVDNKAGEGAFDPVTEADRNAERVMRGLIRAAYPDHGISGEEYGHEPGAGPYAWSLDPIDGTRSYICGLPTWTTLIALLDRDLPVLGVIDTPRLDEIYVGSEDGSWLRTGETRQQLRVSGCTDLSEARVGTTDPFLFAGDALDRFRQLAIAARTTRYGQDAYAYARLAAGGIDLVVECGLKPHDYNALIPVVRGASGTFGDWSGGSNFGAGNVIAAATRELYEAAVEIMTCANAAAEAHP